MKFSLCLVTLYEFSEFTHTHTDLIDIVKEQLYGSDYEEGEDPSKYVSMKTNRGPLAESWLADHWKEVNYGFIVVSSQ